MKKLAQNRVAGSRMTLPVVTAYAVGVWLLCGLIAENWWLQFACFGVTSWLVMVLNNKHALIRIYSRLMSCAYLMLSCSACFLMADLRGGFMIMSMAAAYLLLFQSYQDKASSAMTYYGFLMTGVGSLACPHLLYYVPVMWLMMATQLLSLSWRTWGASVLGLLTPYWFAAGWLGLRQDFTPLAAHLGVLFDFQFPIRHASLGISVWLVFALLMACMLTGTVHIFRKRIYDSIRVRLLYGFFIRMNIFSVVLMLFQPQHYDMLLRMMVLNTAPLLAHFLTLTSTKMTNAAFYLLTALTLSVTVYNVWSMLFPF